jgi:trimethylamine:corrinoid methyltransferase-like protein
MLDRSNTEVLSGKVVGLLGEVGIKVENDEVTRLCLEKGCQAGADHRVRIPKAVIDELVQFQAATSKSYEENHRLVYTCGPDWTHHLVWTRQADAFRERYRREFSMQAFDCGPTKYYDYRAGKSVPVDTEIFETMMKFAEATPEIGYTSMWYRQDVPAMIERLDSLHRSMKLTRKFAGIEAIYPEVVKYLKEASVILTGDPRSSTYLAGSECMTSPLILEERSAEDILERKRHSVNRYHVASMPTIGVSTPTTLAGAVVMGAAEILGGMAICWCVDPGSDISGRMITLVGDMRNGESTTFGPFYTQCNAAVRNLFQQVWGGHCMAEVFLGPTSRAPGMQTVLENLLTTSCRQRWDNEPAIPYAGMGALHMGGTGSPTQFMLDLEIRKAQWGWTGAVDGSDEAIDMDDIVKAAKGELTFLTCDHTMQHFRELWTSPYFRSDGTWRGDEKSILDKCDEAWRGNLARWKEPEYSDTQYREIGCLVERAKREFGLG